LIISASYKTDIPAFYAAWFVKRLHAGYCKMVNPFNQEQHRTVSLRLPDVDGFVFWTKNLSPFFEALGEVSSRGFPFVVQYTVNGYPKSLETRVVDSARAVDHLHRIASVFGPRVAVWRYDPIILSSITPTEYHKKTFSSLCKQLAGATDEVVVSFMQTYQKTRRNLNRAALEHGFSWYDPSPDEKRALLSELSGIAANAGIRLSVCTQPELLMPGVSEARCADAERLVDVGGRTIAAKLHGMRKHCGCFRSIDIGDYDTCPHGCIYCYAVRDRDLAAARFKVHDPSGEYLFPRQAFAKSDQLSLL
jgi:hypothetical protein